MFQACAEARAEEAAAEKQFVEALALERAELVKQARSLLSMCSDRLQRLSLVPHMDVCDRPWARRLHMPCVWQYGAGVGTQLEARLCLFHVPCSAERALPSAQVQQARVEARVEADAAAEQRLAALDQARREEREAVVRVVLALGVGRVRSRPHACSLWHASPYTLYVTQSDRQAAEVPQSTLASGARSALGGAAGSRAFLFQVVCTLAPSSMPVCRTAGEFARQGLWHGFFIVAAHAAGC